MAQSLMISVSRNNISKTKCGHGKIKYLEILSKIAEIQPQAAYSHIYPNLNRNSRFSHEHIATDIIPAIIGSHICSDAERALLELPLKFGGLGLQNLYEVANVKILKSKEITIEIYVNVITDKDFQIESEQTKTIKNELKTKISNYNIKLEELRNSLNEKMKRCNEISNKTG